MKTSSLFKLCAILLAVSFLPVAARADMKARNKMTTAGMDMESTVYVKGSRQRTETSVGMVPGMQMISVHECDLKRIVQINNNTCTYFIAPTADEGTTAATPAVNGRRRGGKVTVTSNITDTGERQQMFGHTARRLKIHLTMEAAPNSCTRANTSIDSDGWYIDVAPALDCAVKGLPARPTRGQADCQDDYIIRTTGSGRPGFPVKVTTNLNAEGSAVTMSQETVELTSATLDPALFEIPAGYREVHSQGELMGGLSGMAAMMGGKPSSGCSGAQPPTSTMTTAQATGMPVTADFDGVRIGIAPINNKTTASFSAEQVRGKLIDLFDGISSIKIDAVPLQSKELPDLDREARQKQCSYILVTNVTGLKEPSAKRKIGGFLGRAAGLPAAATNGTFESSIDYHLYQVGKANAVLDSTADSKEGNDAEDSIAAATTREVGLVLGLVRAQSRK